MSIPNHAAQSLCNKKSFGIFKAVRVALALLSILSFCTIGSPAHANPADDWMQKTIGALGGTLPLTSLSAESCPYYMDVMVEADDCWERYFGDRLPQFNAIRINIGLDSYGEVPTASAAYMLVLKQIAQGSNYVSFSFCQTYPPSGNDPRPMYCGYSDPFTVKLSGTPPIAANQTVSTSTNIPILIDLTVGSSGNPIAAAVSTLPTNGTAEITGATEIAYTPNPGYVGTDSFQFNLGNSGGLSNTATVTINVGTVNTNKNLACNCGIANPGTDEGEPINTGTGNFYTTETDYVGGTATHLSLVRYYNSQDTTVSPFGYGWHSTWHKSLLTTFDVVTATRENGRQDVYTNNGDGTWTAQSDVTSVLSQIPSTGTPTEWQITRDDDSVEMYNLAGQLTSVTTREGLKTTLNYDPNTAQLKSVVGPFNYTLQFSYYTNGNIHQMMTPDGKLTTYQYDANNNLQYVTYPDKTQKQYLYENTSFPHALTGVIDELTNRYSTFAYDSMGRAYHSEHDGGVDATTIDYTNPTSPVVTDPRKYQHTYSLEAEFGLVKPTALSGSPVQSSGGKAFGYDTNGFINSRTDWNNNVTNYTHDTRGNLTQEVDAYNTNLQRTINITPEPNFHLPHQIVEPNRTTTLYHNTNGSLQSKTVVSSNDNGADSGTRTWSYTYWPNTLLNTIVGPRTDINQVTTLTYDALGDLASIEDAAGHTTKIPTYDTNGRPKKIIDPNGLVTLLDYDPRGRLIERLAGTEKTSYGYDKAGNLNQVTLPDGSYLKYFYDTAHRLRIIEDNLGDKITYTPDAADNITKSVINDPNGTLTRTRSFTYDDVNHLKEEIGAQKQTTVYGYDTQGNLTGVQDPNKNITMYTPDFLNRLSGMMDPYKNITAYGYDANDHLTGVQDGRKLTTTYGVDGLNNTYSTLSPDSGGTNRTFDAAGNVLTSTDANGHETKFTYDALNRTKTITYSDGQKITLTYDTGKYGIGHLTQMNDPAGVTAWDYDINGHVTEKQQTTGSIVLTNLYPIGTNGQQMGITYPSTKALTYSFDADQRIAGISIGTQSIISNITYDPFGVAKSWTMGNGATYTRAIDTDGRIAGIQLTGTAQYPATTTLMYGFYPNNTIQTLTETNQPEKFFVYDKLNRLQQLTMGTGTTAPSTLYGYDANGNRNVLETLQGSTVIGTTVYNIAPTSNELNSLTGAQTQNNTYDSDGNLKSDGTNVFTYNARERVATVTNNKVTTTYGFNGLNQRIIKTGTGVLSGQNEYAYDEEGHLLGEYDKNGVAIEETVWLGDIPVAVMTGTGGSAGVYYIAADNINAPHIITDQNGKVVWFWDHLAFGDNAPSIQILPYNQRGNGLVFDQESGVLYNYFRDYNYLLGRFNQADPAGLKGGQPSLYSYVGNNPLSNVDPKGLGPEELLLAPFACAINPICRAGTIILGQRIASNLALSNAVAIQNSPLFIAATDENGGAYVATGLMCGAVKGALPDGLITPGVPVPTIGSESADQAGELLIDMIKEFNMPEQSTPVPQSPPYTPNPN
jgi:RHS repeat-associated protein